MEDVEEGSSSRKKWKRKEEDEIEAELWRRAVKKWEESEQWWIGLIDNDKHGKGSDLQNNNKASIYLLYQTSTNGSSDKILIRY